MLGKGCGVGRIAAPVVRWARAVPLGIKHDIRRVGGLCAPKRTSTPALPGTSEPAARSGGRQWNECFQSTAAATEASPGAFGGLFGCSRRPENKPGRKNIFFVKKWAYGKSGLATGPKVGQFFLLWYQNLPPGKVTGKGSQTRALRIFTTFRPSGVQIW